VLSQHPAVKETLVIDRVNPEGEKQLVAYLVANLQDDALQALHAKQVSLWQALHDKSYQDSPSHADPTFNIIGWDSAYTGLPLPDDEMQECVETTVDKILSLNPQHVLEIGCGTGLLMYRIVSHCVDYVGTELSEIALQQLEDSKRFLKIKGLEHTTLLTKPADDFDGFEAQAFDTLIINSVVQYFPSIDYFLTVLKGALTVVKPGGTIFIGDVRSLPLLKAYHASVQVYKAVDFVTRAKLAARIHERELQEQELIIAPVFFVALKHAFPQISRVKIEPKRGLIRNEMTRFRYDVIFCTPRGPQNKFCTPRGPQNKFCTPRGPQNKFFTQIWNNNDLYFIQSGNAIISEQGFEISNLRLFLEDRLHDYMIPTAFIRLERFPLTPSGKVDLRALPKPDQTRPLLETGYIAPQNELEQSLALIWQNALGLKQIGIEDNLFI